jgi:hypothetical protein
MPVMKLPARLLLAFFAVSLASLTPVLPGEFIPTVQQKPCCADMNMDAGARCPINPGGTTSSSATCCPAPAVCLLLYFGNANAFAVGTEMSGTVLVNDDRVTARSQRPPVPPPRAEFS